MDKSTLGAYLSNGKGGETTHTIGYASSTECLAPDFEGWLLAYREEGWVVEVNVNEIKVVSGPTSPTTRTGERTRTPCST